MDLFRQGNLSIAICKSLKTVLTKKPFSSLLEMKPPNPLIALLGPAILALSCAAIKFEAPGYKPEEKIFLSSLNALPKTSEGEAKRDSLLKVYRFFEIVDKTLFQKLGILNVQADSAQIDSLVESFKSQKDLETRPDTPERNEWWEELWGKRAKYCDENYHSPYFGQYWDLRAKPVLLHGIPEEEYERDETCWTDIPSRIPLTCEIFYLHWISKGIFLALQDDNEDNHPDRFIPHREYDLVKGMPDARTESLLRQKNNEAKYVTVAKPSFRPFEEVEKIVKASLHISSFPENQGNNVTWISLGIPLEQFKSDSSASDCLQIRAVIYNSETQTAIVEDSGTHICTLPANLSWIPVYGNYNLPDGKYRLALTLKRTEKHIGIYTIEFQLPPFTGRSVSDILLSRLPARNDTLLPWICREGNIKIMDNPFSVFSPGDIVYPYFEFSTDNFISDEFGRYSYVITCRLYPIQESKKKPVVEMGPLQIVKDTAAVFIAGDKKKKDQKESGYLIFSTGEKSGLSKDILTSPIQIPKKIPEGQYFLAVSVEDLNSKGRKGNLIAWRQIAIKK